MAEYNPSKIIKDGNTYNFRDNTKIPLSGTNALAGSIVPSTDNTYDFGSSTYKLRYVYAGTIDVTNLNINGSPAGDILTHNASEFVPRSGGAVITGSYISRTDNAGELSVCGGTAYTDGGFVKLLSVNHPNVAMQGTVILSPGKNGSIRNNMSLYPDGAWTWTGSACVVISDSRLKDEIESISDEILDAWENLEPKQYKLKSDLEADKDNAQVHYGWIAQEVESIIKGDRKGDVKNGLWLHEQWEEQAEVSHEEEYTEEVQTKSGKTETVTKTRKVIDTPYKAKGDSYGLRYTECLVVECAYLRKKNKELQEQLDKLSARLDKLEGVQTK